MLNRISCCVVEQMNKKLTLSEEDKQILYYGCQLFFSTLFGMMSIFAISCLFFDYKYAVIFFCIFMPLRTFTGGYHCKSYKNCFIISNLYFIATVLTCMAVLYTGVFKAELLWLLLGACAVYIFLKAPVLVLNNKVGKGVFSRSRVNSRIVAAIDIAAIVSCAYMGLDMKYVAFAGFSLILDVVLMVIQDICNKRAAKRID